MWNSESVLEYYRDLDDDPSGWVNYDRGMILAICRAMDLLKQAGGGWLLFEKWIDDSLSFTRLFPDAMCKCRDVMPHLLALEDYGMIKLHTDVAHTAERWDEVLDSVPWEQIKVRITAEGYLAEKSEYFSNYGVELSETDDFFDPLEFSKLLKEENI